MARCWADPEPAWWLNLQANPKATVELPDGSSRAVTARAAIGEERARIQELCAEFDIQAANFNAPGQIIVSGDKAKVDGPARIPQYLGHDERRAIAERHRQRQMAQRDLRHVLDTWSACFPNRDEQSRYRRFYLTFGTDVLSAMALGAPDANALRERVVSHIRHLGYSI